MSQDDPFADPGDSDKMVIRPNPGGRRTAQPQAPSTAPSPDATQAAPAAARARPRPQPLQAAAGPVVPIAQVGVNPLVVAASSLLGLAIRLRNRASHRNIDSLRERVIAEIRSFESHAASLGVSPQQIRAGRYALCATIDDLVLNTPWGSQSIWAKQSMISVFFNETYGGERFYEILDQLNKNVGRNFEVLELMYLCLTLGFEGQFRILTRGSARHTEIRDGLYRTIRQRRGDFERELSPHWRGVESGHRPLTSFIPLWVVGLATAVLLLLMYMGFLYALSPESSRLYGLMAGLPPNNLPELVRVAQPPRTADSQPPRLRPETPPPQPPGPDRGARYRTFLAPEIQQQLVTVDENGQRIIIRLNAPGRGMFNSGTATVINSFLPVIDRVAQALQDEPGTVLVVGHTDIDPIATLQFPNNLVLSQRRAESVAERLGRTLTDRSRIVAEGRGDTDPLPGIDGTTPDGKRQNRRVDIILRR